MDGVPIGADPAPFWRQIDNFLKILRQSTGGVPLRC